jgi:hypothetical protein
MGDPSIYSDGVVPDGAAQCGGAGAAAAAGLASPPFLLSLQLVAGEPGAWLAALTLAVAVGGSGLAGVA